MTTSYMSNFIMYEYPYNLYDKIRKYKQQFNRIAWVIHD